MQDDTKAQDPLLRAISELRDCLDRLIDEQKSILGGPDGEVSAPSVVVVRPEPGPEPATSAHVAAAEFAPKPRKPAVIAVHERAPEPTRPDVVSITEVAPGSRLSDDPRLRLDALAKHLDRKMRQSCSPAGDTPGRSSG